MMKRLIVMLVGVDVEEEEEENQLRGMEETLRQVKTQGSGINGGSNGHSLHTPASPKTKQQQQLKTAAKNTTQRNTII